jgi:hypothetical protein
MHAADAIPRWNTGAVVLSGRGWRVAVLAVTLAVLPTAAHASPTLTVSTTMPAKASVGDTLPGSFVLANNSTSEDPSFTICTAGDAHRCGGSERIILMPSCGEDVQSRCSDFGIDPDVLKIDEPATGAADTLCSDMTFLTPAFGGTFGEVAVEPTGGIEIRLSQGETCRVDFTFTVLKLPTIDARPEPGIQTAAIVSASARTYLNVPISGRASSVLTVTSEPPAAPVMSAPPLDSFANDNAPQIQGIAPAQTTVSVYTNPSCTGPPAAHGTAAQFASPGLIVSVPDDSAVTFYATATDPATALSSACSTTSRTYVEDSTAPQTTINSGPSGATDDTAPVFTFSANEASASFACRLDGGSFTPCSSPFQTSTLASGSHAFEVRSTDAAGNASATSVNRSFTVGEGTLIPAPGASITVGRTAPPPDLADCALKGSTITGTADKDTLRGTGKTDIIVGQLGNDVLRGLGGRDCVFGDDGTDRLFGGAGADLLFGGLDDDRLSGGAGNDRLSGEAGNDRLSGEAGIDRIDGGAGNDNLLGGPANDRLTDRRGTDRFSSGADNDRIDARDSSPLGRRGRDRISCGGGRDTVLADPLDIVARDCESVRGRSL